MVLSNFNVERTIERMVLSNISWKVSSTAEPPLQEFCRCFKLWRRLPSRPSPNAALAFNRNTSSLCLRDVNLLACFVSKECIWWLLFSLFRKRVQQLQHNVWKNVCNNTVLFSWEYIFCFNVRRCTDDWNNIFNFCKNNLGCKIKSSLKAFNQFEIKLKKTL